MNPVLSVVILNYNRKDELRRTLTDVLAQEGLTPEVVVVDNASADGSQAMVRAEFPSVRLLALPENIGIRARRKAAEAATGRYIVMYDDDSGPSAPRSMACIVDFFDRRPEASALCTAIYRTRSSYFETWNWEAFAVSGDAQEGYEGLFVHGSGTAYRREHLLKTDAFDNDLFWGDEEFDAALSLIAHGYRIFYWPTVVTNHRASLSNRSKGRFYRRVTRNHLLTFLKYFDTPQVLEYSFKEIFYQMLLSRLYFPFVLCGALEALPRAGRARDGRLRIPVSLLPYLKEVRERRYPGFGAWFRQQWALKSNRKSKVF